MRKTNYNTHTERCMHAYGSDEDYVKAAIQAGYEELGFSDHSPWKYDSDFVAYMRMRLDQFDDYYQSIKHLQEKYKDQISIKIGLECEYYERYMDWLQDFCNQYHLDYIILGNHFYQTDENRIYFGRYCAQDEYLEYYVQDIIKAMETGLYAYVCHPDLFMRGRTSFGKLEEEASYRICEAAKRLDLALEYNLAGLEYNERDHVEHYPHREFWKIAAKVGNKAIIGVDAHDPAALKTDYYREKAIAALTNLQIPIIDTIDFKKFK